MTLVAIERAWARAHPEGEPEPDRWGEGPSRLRLADLGLATGVRSQAMVGLCYRHGEFATEWNGLEDEEPPDFLRCTVASDGRRCELSGPVRSDLRARRVRG